MNHSKLQAKVKALNLFTHKLHALGDYTHTIWLFRTTDSYSTQIVCFILFLTPPLSPHAFCVQGELAHQLVKCLYHRTNKTTATRQIAGHECWITHLWRAQDAAQYAHAHHVQFSGDDCLPYTAIDQHHHISDSRNHPLDLMHFMHDSANDPTKNIFLSLLMSVCWWGFHRTSSLS